jgi:hypothetical protein
VIAKSAKPTNLVKSNAAYLANWIDIGVLDEKVYPATSRSENRKRRK